MNDIFNALGIEGTFAIILTLIMAAIIVAIPLINLLLFWGLCSRMSRIEKLLQQMQRENFTFFKTYFDQKNR